MKPIITITYCTKCRWMMRAAWMAQELLTTFDQEVEAISLKPDHSGGVFQIHVEDTLIFTRTSDSGFPEIKEIKQMIRDIIAPKKSLGHSDRKHTG